MSVTQEGTLEEPCHRAIICCGIISYSIVFKEIMIRRDSSPVRDQRGLDDDQNQRFDRNYLLNTNYLMSIPWVCIKYRYVGMYYMYI